MNPEALENYLTFQYSVLPETFFKGIYKLMPSHSITFENGKVIIKRYWEPVFEDVIKQSKEEIAQMTEEEYETFVECQDPTAKVVRKSIMQNVRELDRSIGESLKMTYGYRCQMTGEYVGEQHGVSCVEAHHILPFVESLDNSTDNLMVLSPNYHRIIHKAKPHFNRKTLSFEYPNGLIEKVKLNLHL